MVVNRFCIKARKELEESLTSHTLQTSSTTFFESGSALVLAMAEAEYQGWIRDYQKSKGTKQ